MAPSDLEKPVASSGLVVWVLFMSRDTGPDMVGLQGGLASSPRTMLLQTSATDLDI